MAIAILDNFQKNVSKPVDNYYYAYNIQTLNDLMHDFTYEGEQRYVMSGYSGLVGNLYINRGGVWELLATNSGTPEVPELIFWSNGDFIDWYYAGTNISGTVFNKNDFGFATESFVYNQNYASLDYIWSQGYATESWVNSQSYVTSNQLYDAFYYYVPNSVFGVTVGSLSDQLYSVNGNLNNLLSVVGSSPIDLQQGYINGNPIAAYQAPLQGYASLIMFDAGTATIGNMADAIESIAQVLIYRGFIDY